MDINPNFQGFPDVFVSVFPHHLDIRISAGSAIDQALCFDVYFQGTITPHTYIPMGYDIIRKNLYSTAIT
jgi:hypothetical protein